LLSQQIAKCREQEELLRRNFSNLESLKPIYNQLRDKFPGEDIKTIINKYDRLEKYIVDFATKVDELEDEKRTAIEERNDIAKQMDKKDFVIKDEEIKRIKIAKEFREKLDAKEHELSEQNHYRDQYHRLNNQVIDLYNQWR